MHRLTLLDRIVKHSTATFSVLTGGNPKKKQHQDAYDSGENSKDIFELHGSLKMPPAKERVLACITSALESVADNRDTLVS